MSYIPSERDAKAGLRDHVVERARLARARHGPIIDDAAILRILDDREIVRYPAGVRFDKAALRPGEFAWAAPLGEHPREGYCIFVHPRFEHQRDLWPIILAYYLPTINYGDIASSDDCELFGATLLGLDVEDYYNTLCALSDEFGIDAPAERKTP